MEFELDGGHRIIIHIMTITKLAVDHGRYSGTSVADGDGAILNRVWP